MKLRNYTVAYPHVLTAGSSIGLVASFWQATERIHMLKYPAEPLSCNLSPIVDCGSVLSNKAAAIFGPPNSFIGMVAFSLLFAWGVQRLSGGKWSKSVHYTVLFLSIILLMFSLWFFVASVYVIGKICIFCIFIWTASVPLATFGVKDFYEQKLSAPAQMKHVLASISRNALTVTAYLYLLLVATFFLHFKDYYF